MNSKALSEEALTPEEIEGLKAIGIISQNWYAVAYDKNTRPYAIFDSEEYAKAYRDQFSITSIVEPWPMIIKDLRKGVSQFKSKEPDRIVRCSVSTGANPLTIRESKDNIPSLSEDRFALKQKFLNDMLDGMSTHDLFEKYVNIPEPDSQKEDVDKMFNEWIGNPAVDNQEELWADVLKTLGFFPSPRYLIEVKEKFHISRKPYNPE